MTKIQGFGLALALAAGISAAWGACKQPAAPGGILLTGAWGSEQGQLRGTEVNTTFRGACGSGNTSEPIMLDRHGRFDMPGTYGASGAQSGEARFVGAVGDHTLTLRVMLADSSVAVGPITLHLDQLPRLATCQ